jgi:hypothetical protein
MPSDRPRTPLTDVDRARALLDARDGEVRANIRGDVAALALAFRAVRREARAQGIEVAAQVGYRTAPDVESGMRVYAAIRALASPPPGSREPGAGGVTLRTAEGHPISSYDGTYLSGGAAPPPLRPRQLLGDPMTPPPPTPTPATLPLEIETLLDVCVRTSMNYRTTGQSPERERYDAARAALESAILSALREAEARGRAQGIEEAARHYDAAEGCDPIRPRHVAAFLRRLASTCPNCENGSGYTRHLGRDNDEIVENCPNHLSAAPGSREPGAGGWTEHVERLTLSEAEAAKVDEMLAAPPTTPAATDEDDWSHRCPECGATVCSHVVLMSRRLTPPRDGEG